MSFDGMVTGAVVHQLQKLLIGGKIEKIYQPEADEIILNIHSGRENHKLYISANSSHSRIHLISETTANPLNPMGFCMLLRKHIQGGRITDIKQMDSERIIEISIDTINELGFSVNKKLIVEIMGKHSNIILVDITSNKIIDCIKRISIDVNRYRQLLPGQQYVYPPSQGKVPYYGITEAQIELFTENIPGNAPKALLSNIQGISPVIAEEIVYRAGLLEEDRSYTAITHVLNSLVNKIGCENTKPKVYLAKDGTPFDFHLFPLITISSYYTEKGFDDISKTVSYYYSNKSSSNRVKQKSSDLVRAVGNSLDKLYLKKQRLSNDLLAAEKSDIYRLYGELLTANLHQINHAVSSVELFNYYSNDNISIPLDSRFTPAQNAQKYFKKYSKAKTAVTEKNIQLEETNNDIAYIESVLNYIENANTIEEIEELRLELIEGGYLRKRKNNFKPSRSKVVPFQYTTSDGFRVLVGRNNKENDILTFKTASGKDIWFHTKDIPGSHVILFTDGKRVTDSAIFEAASLAAYHSKGRESENVPVDYTQVRHVKKPNGAKPGMVIFTDNKTVYVNPKEL
ncbi:MAG: NFACT RNA binding domain-containing protein [Eubacteriales bacterium]|nr:NFACT RNA binding domain-containing protein [Eubacteriales bacterium]MDD3198932.1 NFACT RNA binding domain-containing protein [Eubacteriales bacterium]MDD4121489.1 NFACT RNA binding domain-containing protein [Eubacteriales bacterium]MDD4629582.1 NFACT RNA binding domain-containing protein [Eubacteriales bacterium]